ncbi:hypothetical protein HDU98_011838, partial [Podochytrium sp. JEL0797]
MHFLRGLLALGFASLAVAKPATAKNNRVLVVLNEVDQKADYSQYLGALEARGFALTFKAVADDSTNLVLWEELAYHHLLLLADAQVGPAIAPAKVVDFINRGGNVLVAASSKVSETIRDIGIEMSADFDEKNNAVFDAFHNVEGQTDAVVASRVVAGSAIIPPSLAATIASGSTPLVFKGVGHRLTGKNPLAMSVLVGNPTSYSYLQSNQGLTAPPASALVGSTLSLVSVLQARNNARVAFSGSVDLFKDEFAGLSVGSKKTANAKFVNELSKWVFQEKGVLEVRKTFHHRPTETQQHGSYRIKEDLVYEIEFSEYHSDAWHPYVSTTPVQFTATMLDPYIRQNMTLTSKTSTSSVYTLPFLTPDV